MSASSVRVVPIGERHITGFHAAVDSVAREKHYLAMARAFPLKSTREFVRGNIRRRNPHFVALAGDRVVGWCDIQVVPRDTQKHSGILGMGIIEGFRGKGVGCALMRAALERARKRGLTRVELTVREDNRRAMGLYKKVGFAIEGRKRDAVRVDGRYYDLLSMAVLFKRSGA